MKRRPRIPRIDLLLAAAFVAGMVAWGATAPHARTAETRSVIQVERTSLREKLAAADQQTLERRAKENPSLARKMQLVSLFLSLTILASGAALFWAAGMVALRRHPFPRLGVPPLPAWTLGDILRVVFAALIVTIWMLVLESVLARGQPKIDLNMVTLGNTLMIDTVVIAGAWLLLARRPGRSTAPPAPSVRFALRGYLTFLPLLVLLMFLVSVGVRALDQEPTPQEIFTMFLSESRAPVLGWLLFLVAVAGPVAEELFFRGLLYGWLRDRLGIGRALCVSALLFALLHANAMVLVPIFALGLFLGWLYEKTGSLAAPVAVHVLHNSGMMCLAAVVKEALTT